MAIYRFKISFEDYDEVEREIDIKSTQTFEDLHRALHRSTGYPVAASSSFYVSNDFWYKGQEITFLPSEKKIEQGVSLMDKSKLSSFIDDPHQKFYYTYNFERPFDFHVQLIKIILDEENGKEYPNTFRSVGEAPKIPGSVIVPGTSAIASTKRIDFLDELEFDPSHLEDVDELDLNLDTDISTAGGASMEQEETEAEEENEFMDDFSDNENYDNDEY
ncbi:MAG: plasmid pRiA4b ORF-3 family protein [Sphingobacteriaceae bacterium]|nr:plasmid pRiA4b ORF-3 family protein [Sphingobacteriaceae bacterium]